MEQMSFRKRSVGRRSKKRRESRSKKRRESRADDDGWWLDLPPARTNLCSDRYIVGLYSRDQLISTEDFLKKKKKLFKRILPKLGIRARPDPSLESLALFIRASRSGEDDTQLLQEIVYVARIFYMDEVELYFMEFHAGGDDGPSSKLEFHGDDCPSINCCRGPFSPRNELESLSSIVFAIRSLGSDSIFLANLKKQVSEQLNSFANDNSDLYTDLHLHVVDSDASTDPCTDELMRWGLRNNVKAMLRIADVSEGGKGLVACKDIQIGDIVLEIPKELVISDDFEREMPGSVHWKRDFTSKELLAWRVMKERDDLELQFSSYFKTLPKELKIGLGFREDALDALSCTELDMLGVEIKCIKGRFEELCRVFEMHSSLSGKETLEAYTEAYKLVCSYGVEVLSSDGTYRAHLVPIAQFFNHSLFPHVLNCEWGENSLKFTASRHCGSGQQCYLSYGNFSGSELVTYYGFLPKGINPRDVIFLEPDFDGMFEGWGHNKDEWNFDMVRVEVPCIGAKVLSAASLTRLCALIKTYWETVPKELQRITYRTLKRHLLSYLCTLYSSEKDWANKHGGKREESWDDEVALGYMQLVKDIARSGVLCCHGALRLLPPDGHNDNDFVIEFEEMTSDCDNDNDFVIEHEETTSDCVIEYE